MLGVVCCCLVVWAWDFWWVFVLVAVGGTVWVVGALVFVICGWVLMGLFVCCVRLLLLWCFCCGGEWLLLTILVVLLGFWTNLFLIAGGCGLFDLVRCAACCGCWAVGLG